MLTEKLMTGIADELSFWKSFVNSANFLRNWVYSTNPIPVVQPEAISFFGALSGRDNLKVLDIGSGVMSILTNIFPKQNITTLDPLGSLYPFIFDYELHSVMPPIPCGGEEMSFVDQFDIVHISNAIDHSQDPGRVFEKMKLACKPDGILVVQGFENEAIWENWQGFHQWNFSIDDKSGSIHYHGKDQKEPFALEASECIFHTSRILPDNPKKWFFAAYKNS
jgi:SAM-dependent methyltransferase